VETLLEEGVDAAMNRFNERLSKPGDAPATHPKEQAKNEPDPDIHPGWTG
jgi:hypothetical protein